MTLKNFAIFIFMFSQNRVAVHGRGVYQKGVAHKRPNYPSIAKAHDRLVEVTKTGNLNGAIIYEYIPLQKIKSVPSDATAFRRELVSSILVNLSWDQKLQDRTAEARKYAYEIAAILAGDASDLTNAESLGYSNYGQFFASICPFVFNFLFQILKALRSKEMITFRTKPSLSLGIITRSFKLSRSAMILTIFSINGSPSFLLDHYVLNLYLVFPKGDEGFWFSESSCSCESLTTTFSAATLFLSY